MNRSVRHQSPSTSNSPFTRGPSLRSPTKASSNTQELGLNLKQVIGTTCASVNAFDTLPSSRCFAYTAGAAAVVAKVDQDLNITQRFFRATSLQTASSRAPIQGFGVNSPSAQRLRDLRSPRSVYGRESESPFNTSTYEGADSPNSRNGLGPVKERVKAATAVSFAPNGKWIAVGETGYKPRVLVFSLAEGGSNAMPVAVIPEHTFGVHALAFSPESSLLASLGTVNDGFLYIWKIDDRTGTPSLVASNKCTNVVKQMAWIGRSLVTVGQRFVKIWRPDEMTASASGGDPKYGLASPAHRPLAGRNCLLGDLLEATFTSVIALSADQAVICSDAGDVCLLDDSENTARVSKLFSLGVGITAASAGADGLVYVTDVDANTHVFRIDENMSVFPTSADESQENGHATKHATHVVAMGYLGDSVVTLDSKHGIQLRSVPSLDDDDPQPKVLYRLPAHEDAVLGVRALPQPNDLGAEILSWSAGGTVILWDAACQPTAAVQVPLEQSDDAYHAVNELKTVIHLQKTLILAGDKYGVLRVLDACTNEASCIIRAHSADITDLAVHADTRNCFVASSGRDRTAQLFRWGDGRLELLQTLDEHAGAVTTVLFAKNGDQLLSCSTDRSIVVREVLDMGADKSVAYVITRTIALKSAPTSMRTSLYEDMLLVSTSDKYVQLVNTSSGRIMQSFKTADAEGGDAVIMSCIVHLPSAAGPPIIAGVASSDKSIRLYSEDGTLLARDWGHTEGVTSIALVQNSNATSQSSQTQTSDLRLISAAADGTILIWDTSTPRRSPSDPSKSFDSPVPQPLSGSLGPPLRKVISMTEIARFTQSRSGEDSEPSSPTALKSPMSPTLRKKMSRLSISRAPKLEPSPSINGLRQRSPSPPSPLRKTQAQETSSRRQSIGPGSPLSRNSAAINGVEEDHGAKGSTEQLCRTLRAYRKGTTSYIADVPASALAELERELRLTLQLAKKGQDMPTKEPASPAKRTSVRHDTSNENSKPNTPLKTNRLSANLQQGNEDTKERPGAGTHGMSNDEKMEADVTAGAEAMGQGVQS